MQDRQFSVPSRQKLPNVVKLDDEAAVARLRVAGLVYTPPAPQLACKDPARTCTHAQAVGNIYASDTWQYYNIRLPAAAADVAPRRVCFAIARPPPRSLPSPSLPAHLIWHSGPVWVPWQPV